MPISRGASAVIIHWANIHYFTNIDNSILDLTFKDLPITNNN